uniref:enoyl-CoA hydratase/isomerase family protein n=1 Tax=uncultured Sphingomonas sp. TaxID=158754 RepID=UPI0035C9CB7B
MKETIGAFALDVDAYGVCVATFSRPPVNAVSIAVYEDLGRLVDRVESDDTIRAVVLAAPGDARAWCGGADLKDFVDIEVAARKQRYAFINVQLPRFYAMDRPVIAAINGAAIGVGMILAALCDMRVVAEDARFACPEIDYGLVAGGAALFAHVNMPEAKIREMMFTGARFTARELEPTGFFNYVVPRAEVLPRAIALAQQIATKSLPALRARKVASAMLEGRGWVQAYLDAQALSAELTAGRDGGEGVRAFLAGRAPDYQDR